MVDSKGAVLDIQDTSEIRVADDCQSDYRLSPADEIWLSNASAAQRFEVNVDAIRRTKEIAGGREPTDADRAVIARYSGMGDSGYNDAFPNSHSAKPNKRLVELGQQLRELLTPQEYDSLGRSRLNAHFTSPTIVRAMWDALERFGIGSLPRLKVLEPSAGSGRFLALMPERLHAVSDITAVEMDVMTGTMLEALFPEASVYTVPLQRLDVEYPGAVPDESQDVVISNVPFGQIRVADPAYAQHPELTSTVHNYFFVKGLAKTRPGGVVAFITSHYTFDAASEGRTDFRRYLADRAELLGAIRLPSGAFNDTAVTTDILFFRKRESIELDSTRSDPSAWLFSDTRTFMGKDGPLVVNVNRYFLENADMALGAHGVSDHITDGREGYALLKDGSDIEQRLRQVVSDLPSDVVVAGVDQVAPSATTVAASKAVDGSFVEGDDGALHSVFGVELRPAGRYVTRGSGKDRSREWTAYSDGEVIRIRAMLAIHDAGREILDMQREGVDGMRVSLAQMKLRRAYEAFVSKYGPLHSRKNRSLMRTDARSYWLQALENWSDAFEKRFSGDGATKRVTASELIKLRGDIFSKVVQSPDPPMRHVTSVQDALAVTLNDTGRLALFRIGVLLGRTVDDVTDELHKAGLIYRNPATQEWETADQYLSGEVKRKLAEALTAADGDAVYQVNVDALKKVQPEPIAPGDIDVRLGTAWVPQSDINQFVYEELCRPGYAQYGDIFRFTQVAGMSKWIAVGSVGDHAWKLIPEKITEYGTNRIGPLELVEHALNARQVRIMDNVGTSAEPHYVLNEDATRAATGKVRALKAVFVTWLWSDPDRTVRLAEYYNETYNATVLRTYDGSHLTLANANPNIKLRPLQKDAVWRGLQEPSMLLAHQVGYGKSFSMSAIVMEMRRLGMARKPAIVVPNHLVGQMAGEFLKLYPQANLLVPSKADYDADGRASLMARIAGGDWDAVIFAQSQFKLLGLHPATFLRFTQEQYDELHDAIMDYPGEKSERTYKQLRKRLENAATDLQRAQDRLHAFQSRKGVLTWDELGIDALIVDEADAFKNLEFFTHRARIRGLPNSRSDRAMDMHMKTRLLFEKWGRGPVFATGTPISNTIAELWTMMRYLAPETMRSLGLATFDAWASVFGDTVEKMEQTLTGEWKVITRFARFGNAPELSKLFQSVADIRMGEDSPEMESTKPKLLEGRRVPVKSLQMDWHKAYAKQLAKRASELKGSPEPGADNMLLITGDARKASLCPSLVGGPIHPNGKIPMMVDKVCAVWEREARFLGTQLVFIDMGTPKSADVDKSSMPSELKARIATAKVEAGEAWDAGDEQAIITAYYQEYGSASPDEWLAANDVYNRILARLLARGIPRAQIAFIHDAKDDRARKMLFEAVNNGDIRVLIGSTEKMGAGMNVQKRLCALHHLDTPWRPRDLEQREGRMLRPGNVMYGPPTDEFGMPLKDSNGEPRVGRGVEIFQYVTEWPFDAYLWSTLLAKMRAIKSMMCRSVVERSVVDVGEHILDMEELEALASGDPMALKRKVIQEEERQLAAEERDHRNLQARYSYNQQNIVYNLQQWEVELPRMQENMALLEKAGTGFKIEIDGQVYTKRPDVGWKLGEALVRASQQSHELNPSAMYGPPVQVGSLKGFVIEVRGFATQAFEVRLRNPEHPYGKDLPKPVVYPSTVGLEDLTPRGILQRVENLTDQIGKSLVYVQNAIVEGNERLLASRSFARKPYAGARRLQQLRDVLDMIERRMKGEKKLGPDEQPLKDADGHETPIFSDDEIDFALETMSDRGRVDTEASMPMYSTPVAREDAAYSAVAEAVVIVQGEAPASVGVRDEATEFDPTLVDLPLFAAESTVRVARPVAVKRARSARSGSLVGVGVVQLGMWG